MKMVMPKMGMTMEEGTIVEWKKKDGEYVEKGEIILEIMTNKVNIDVEAPVSGYLKVLKGIDEIVPVGEAVALIEESVQATVPERVMPERVVPEPVVPTPHEREKVHEVRPVTAKIPASPRARQVAEEYGIPLEEITGTGPHGAVTEKDVLTTVGKPAPEAPDVTPGFEPVERSSLVSPLAERIARDKGVDLSKVKGTGLDGKVTKDDVLKFIKGLQAMPGKEVKPTIPEERPTPAVEPPAEVIPEKPTPAVEPPAEVIPEKPTPAEAKTGIIAEVAELTTRVQPEPVQGIPKGVPVPEGIPLTGIKKVTAERMVKSKREAPHLTLGMEVDMTEASKLKTSLTITYTDILVKATALALKAHPIMNSTLQGGNIVLRDAINIGIAVARKEDLLVPVVYNADTLSLRKIAQTTKDLIERTRSNQLTEKDVLDGTFTISNLGMYDIDFFTPIINPPEAAILGVGKIAQKAVVVDNQIRIRERTTLSLSFDHRIVNGMPAALFLKEIKDLLEHPYKLLVKEEGL
jgi:pyruvate dehydrogenase E2 component (dihydrolipoamide acetyltransferase)